MSSWLPEKQPHTRACPKAPYISPFLLFSIHTKRLITSLRNALLFFLPAREVYFIYCVVKAVSWEREDVVAVYSNRSAAEFHCAYLTEFESEGWEVQQWQIQDFFIPPQINHETVVKLESPLQVEKATKEYVSDETLDRIFPRRNDVG